MATRVRFIVAFEGLQRHYPRLSARRCCEATEVPYPTFAHWRVGAPSIRGTVPFSTAPAACRPTSSTPSPFAASRPNGSEFGRALTFLLQRLGIRHARIRPRSPHLNGEVERARRTVQEE